MRALVTGGAYANSGITSVPKFKAAQRVRNAPEQYRFDCVGQGKTVSGIDRLRLWLDTSKASTGPRDVRRRRAILRRDGQKSLVQWVKSTDNRETAKKILGAMRVARWISKPVVQRLPALLPGSRVQGRCNRCRSAAVPNCKIF
jgi:hypothetical protein